MLLTIAVGAIAVSNPSHRPLINDLSDNVPIKLRYCSDRRRGERRNTILQNHGLKRLATLHGIKPSDSQGCSSTVRATVTILGILPYFVPVAAATLEEVMAIEHVRGTVSKVKGAVKGAVGKLTGSKKMQAEGKLDKAKGTVQNAAGDVKDRAHRATK